MNLYLTNSGQELLYKAQGGKELNFTRFGLGDGELGGQAIQPLKSLLNEKLPAEIKKLEIKNNKVIIGMSFTNAELVEGFFLRELGLYAKDPDTGEEVLYIYGNSGETSDYIDSNTGRVIEEILDVEIYISDVENITATIDTSLVYATQKDIEDIRQQFAGMTIPKKTSDLENDSGFLTQEADPTVPEWAKQSTKPTYTYNEINGKPDTYTPSSHTHVAGEVNGLSTVATSGNYSDLNGTPDIPNKTSDLSNDSGFKSIEASTEELEAGVSVLETGKIHLTYE